MPAKRPPEKALLTVLTDDHPLMPIAQSLCPGSLYQWITDTPGQCEKYLGFLVDDRYVLHFELPYRGPRIPQEIEIQTLQDFRHEIGQGKFRIKIDAATVAAQDYLAQMKQVPGNEQS